MPRTPADRSMRRRTMALAACALGAIAIHSVGLALADGASALAVPSTHRAVRGEPAMLLVVPARTSAAPEAAAKRSAPPAAIALAVPTAAVPPRATLRPPAEPASRREIAAAGAATEPVRFYRLSEVDAPAEPAEDWAIDLDSLDALGLARVAFEVLVSDRGAIVSCALIGAPDLSAELRASLEQRIKTTDMKPAVRAGLRVASVRHIELYVESPGALETPS